MSLVSPPECREHFTESTDVKIKSEGDSTLELQGKDIKCTALIATIEKDEPVVTRKELWSYYRASSSCPSPSFLTRT